MKKICFIFSISLLLISCWNEQWEDRVASGDTGSITHGKVSAQVIPVKSNIDSAGKELFNLQCNSCHLSPEKRTEDPTFENIRDKTPNPEWIYMFVRNGDSLRKSGDTFANALYQEYNNIRHPQFTNLTNNEIDEILNYYDRTRNPKTFHR